MKPFAFIAVALCGVVALICALPSAESQVRDTGAQTSGPETALPPDILADKFLRQIKQLMREGDYEEARKALEKLLALQQEHGLEPDPEDHYLHAQVWVSAGVPERAIRVCRPLPEAARPRRPVLRRGSGSDQPCRNWAENS